MDELTVIEGEAVRLEDEPSIDAIAPSSDVPSEWAGDCPFFLVIEFADPPVSGHLGIDLDFGGWAKDNAWAMREPGCWWLFSKQTQSPVAAVTVEPGDQPYFVRHHVGNIRIENVTEITTYGLGKKRANGEVVAIWLLPNGAVCGGDDVDTIAARIVNG